MKMPLLLAALCATLFIVGSLAAGVHPYPFPEHLRVGGNVSAVYALIERILPGQSVYFNLSLVDARVACPNATTGAI